MGTRLDAFGAAHAAGGATRGGGRVRRRRQAHAHEADEDEAELNDMDDGGGDVMAVLGGLALESLPDDISELLGWDVVNVYDMELVGEVVDVLNMVSPAHDDLDAAPMNLLRVAKHSALGEGEVLIPAVESILPCVCFDTRQVFINPPPGLLELAGMGKQLDSLRAMLTELQPAIEAMRAAAEMRKRQHLRRARRLGEEAGEGGTEQQGHELLSELPSDAIRAPTPVRLEGMEAKALMPTRKELEAAGREELVAAIVAAGGFSAVAQQLNFRTRRRPAGYWDDEGVLDFELEGFVAASWTEHVEPQTDDTYFYNSVSGEMRWQRPVMEQMWEAYDRPYPCGDDTRPSQLHQEQARAMPTKAAVIAAGRYDLHHAITYWGGYKQVAKMLGRQKPRLNSFREYIDIDALQEELQAMMESGEMAFDQQGDEPPQPPVTRIVQRDGEVGLFARAPRFPTAVQIMDAGRMDVLAAIEYHGGVDRVAVFMGLRAPRRPQRHWHSAEVAAEELLGFVMAHKESFVLSCGRCKMPTHTQLRRADRQDLRYAIQVHGSAQLAQLTGLVASSRGRKKGSKMTPS